MGRSDALLQPIYKKLASQIGYKQKIAVLGSPGPYFVSNLFHENCDFFDMQLRNWDINSDWSFSQKYDLIISTRCPYFAKDPCKFITKCYSSLSLGGSILLDWGYGDHWRFPNYKIGWLKNGEQECCYGENNYLWSGIWDDSFLNHSMFRVFSEWVLKFGYTDVKKAIFEETPTVMPLSFVEQYFDITTDLLSLWKNKPQLYIFVAGFKKVLTNV